MLRLHLIVILLCFNCYIARGLHVGKIYIRVALTQL